MAYSIRLACKWWKWRIYKRYKNYILGCFLTNK